MIVTHHNYVRSYTNDDVLTIGEVYTLPSKTIPDQSLTLREMLERYVRNPDSVEVFNPVFTDDPELDGLERLDAVERAAMAKEQAEIVHNFRKGQKVPVEDKVSEVLQKPSDAPTQDTQVDS